MQEIILAVCALQSYGNTQIVDIRYRHFSFSYMVRTSSDAYLFDRLINVE